MAAGIRVIWPQSLRQHDGEEIDCYPESEYFYGIDVDCLDDLPGAVPELIRVRSVGKQDNLEFEYVIDTRVEGNPRDGVRLLVSYDRKRNAKEGYDSSNPQAGVKVVQGTNTIVLHQGMRTGDCKWLPTKWDGEPLEGVTWKALDAPRGSERVAKFRKRVAKFRKKILALDSDRCVLTDEPTKKALEAAHLIPANMGGPDISCNGIALRADLHRLFDAGLFTFAEDGRVMDIAPGLSEDYRQLLENCDRLPSPTHERVRVTLASRPFQRRGDPAGC